MRAIALCLLTALWAVPTWADDGAAQALAREGHSAWNADGVTLFRLVRIADYLPPAEVRRELLKVEKRLSEENHANVADLIRAVRSIGSILTDANGHRGLRQLYSLFLIMLANRKVEVDLQKLKRLHSVLQMNYPKPRDYLLEDGAGLVHLEIFEGYYTDYSRIPDFKPENAEDHFDSFDSYLESIGIKGFSDFIEQIQTHAPAGPSGFLEDVKRGLRLSKWAMATMIVGGCALTLASFTHDWVHEPAATRMNDSTTLQSAEAVRDAHEAKASRAASQKGLDALPRLLD